MENRKIKILTLAITVVALPLGLAHGSTALGGDFYSRVSASDGAPDNMFGWSVAVDGDTMVVGAPAMESYGDPGAVYVYKHTGIAWVEVAKLTASDADPGDAFGSSVAIDGGTIVVGAMGDVPSYKNMGSVYVFNGAGPAWVEVAKLVPETIEVYFGHSVAIEGGTIAVGAPMDALYSGASVHVFNGAGPTWVEVARLTASDAAYGDHFGSTLAIDGGTIVVGSPGDDHAGKYSGSAYVFNGAGPAWVEVAKLTASDADAYHVFGTSVAIDGGTIVVGSPGEDNAGWYSGSAYVFNGAGPAWVETAKLIGSKTTENANSGRSVAIHANTIVVGSPGACAESMGCGSAYVFKGAGSLWVETLTFTTTEHGDSEYGYSVATDGSSVAVGAYFGDDGGSAYAATGV